MSERHFFATGSFITPWGRDRNVAPVCSPGQYSIPLSIEKYQRTFPCVFFRQFRHKSCIEVDQIGILMQPSLRLRKIRKMQIFNKICLNCRLEKQGNDVLLSNFLNFLHLFRNRVSWNNWWVFRFSTQTVVILSPGGHLETHFDDLVDFRLDWIVMDRFRLSCQPQAGGARYRLQ